MTLAAFAFAAPVSVPPPLPPQPVTETFFGTAITDPYRFLENPKDPAVQSWMRAQADATTSILARIPGRTELLRRIEEIDAATPAVVTSVRRQTDGSYFYLKRAPTDNQYNLMHRASPSAPERMLFDMNEVSTNTGRPWSIVQYRPSNDGRYVAIALAGGGSEVGTLSVLDVRTRAIVGPTLDRARYPSPLWLDDGRGFFYIRLRPDEGDVPREQRFQNARTYLHMLGETGEDRAVFGPGVVSEVPIPPAQTGVVYPVPGTDVALGLVRNGVQRELAIYHTSLAAIVRGDARWSKIVDFADGVHAFTVGGGFLYLRTTAGAPRFKVLRVALSAPDLARAESVVPPHSAVVTDIQAASDALYVTERDGAVLKLYRIAHRVGAKPQPVSLPVEGNVQIASAHALQRGAVLSLGNWTRAARYYAYDPATGAHALELQPAGAFDAPPGLAVREVKFRSHDGIEVPMSILARADVRLTGSNPTILYGYGAYGITEDPQYVARLLAFLERGGVYAFAHVRGGGAYGEEWHNAGRKATKPNTWKDGIAAAEYLIAQRWTRPERIAIYGGSAGGIFVGRAITERPDLFAAAVAAVGVFDMVRAETTANGVANIPEFGTVGKEDELRALVAMDSLRSVSDGVRYPAMMLVHGVNDIRVDVWQSLKMASRLAAATSSGKPVLLRLDYESGHSQGATREQLERRTADIWSFLLWQLGEPAFQPSP